MSILSRALRPLFQSELEAELKRITEEQEREYRELQKDYKVPIERVFKCGNTQYYKLKDIFNTTCPRAFSAISFYEELRMKCTREFLILHLNKQKEYKDAIKQGLTIKDGQLNLAEVFEALKESVTLDEQIKERLELIYEPDSMMKLASIVFFDDTEDPLKYDYSYGIEKVNKWKKNNIDGFFLNRHMTNIVDYSSLTEEDFQNYTKIAEELNKVHLENLSSTL